MKKIILFVAVLGAAFTLTGCDLNNDQMKDVITKCKEDVECKEILDAEIDEALAERGISADNFNSGYDDYYEYYDDFDYIDIELTDEELALFDILDALDEELYAKLDSMTDEDFKVLELAQLSNMLGRALTVEETDALTLIEALYNVDVEDEAIEWPEFDTEEAYLAYYLGRALTVEEVNAFTIIEALYIMDEEAMNETFEFTEEQEAAFQVIDALYNEAFNDMESKVLEMMLNRSLTIEEQTALDIVNNLYESTYETFDEDYDFIQETIDYYEIMLERTLTDQEIEALNLSLDFMYFDTMSIEEIEID